jgi:DNA-binding NarL/FixJ family response regulator
MSFFLQLLQKLGLAHPSQTRLFELDEELHASLLNLAAREQRPMEEVATELLHHALEDQQSAEAQLDLWYELSPRQQDIAALICLRYTNPQIAARLQVSPETVKTHIRSILLRFGVRSKTELRQALYYWDFSAWEKQKKRIPRRG